MKQDKIIGVITGDIINSSTLSEELKFQIKDELVNFTRNNQHVLLPIQFYRGDSFQLMCTKEKSVWLAVLIQSIIISTANTLARISIGIGKVSNIHANDVLQSEGEAFLLSGHQLDEMKADDRILKIAVDNAEILSNLDIATLLAENIIKGWKPGQASVISTNPGSVTQRIIAAQLKISPAAVSKTLKASNWAVIEKYLNWSENILTTNLS
jgi:hypothetical protein